MLRRGEAKPQRLDSDGYRSFLLHLVQSTFMQQQLIRPGCRTNEAVFLFLASLRLYCEKGPKTKRHKREQTLFLSGSVSSRQKKEAAATPNRMFLPLFHRGAANPPGNKQKRSVRAHEAPGRQWPPPPRRKDTLMPSGVPVTESCERASERGRLVSPVGSGSG